MSGLLLKKDKIKPESLPTYHLLFKEAVNHIFITPQNTKYTCGPAAYSCLMSEAPHDLELEFNLLLIGRLAQSVLLLAPSFLKISDAFKELDKVHKSYFLATKKVEVDTIDDKLIDIMLKFEEVSEEKRDEFIKSVRSAYEELFRRYRSKIKIVSNEDDFHKELEKYVMDPKYTVVALFYNDKSHIDEYAKRGIIGTPHWMVLLGVTGESVYIIYDPATSTILWMEKEKLIKNFRKLLEIGAPPQFVVTKR